MKKIILASFFVGVLVGAVLVTWLFAMNEYGYFDSPHVVSADALFQKMERSRFDSHGEWTIEPYSDTAFLVTYQLPFKRETFLVSSSSISSIGVLTRRKKLLLVDGQLSTVETRR